MFFNTDSPKGLLRKTTQNKSTLAIAEKSIMGITCEYAKVGNGKRQVLFIGPMDPYVTTMNIKQPALMKQCTFHCIDPFFSYRRNGESALSDQQIKATTLEKMLFFYVAVVKKLKLKNFYVMGPSILGNMASHFAEIWGDPLQAQGYKIKGVIAICPIFTPLGIDKRQEQFEMANFTTACQADEERKTQKRSRPHLLSSSSSTTANADEKKETRELKRYPRSAERNRRLAMKETLLEQATSIARTTVPSASPLDTQYAVELFIDQSRYHYSYEDWKLQDLLLYWQSFNTSFRAHFFTNIAKHLTFPDRYNTAQIPTLVVLGMWDGIAIAGDFLDKIGSAINAKDLFSYILPTGHNPHYEGRPESANAASDHKTNSVEIDDFTKTVLAFMSKPRAEIGSQQKRVFGRP